MIKVEVANEQGQYDIDAGRLKQAVRAVLDGESVTQADVSVAIVDDPTIHVLNRKYLQHDYATDVLSFLLSGEGESLEGEVVASVDTANRESTEYGWSWLDELSLYIIHGTLHLLGYDDSTDAEREKMRAKEEAYLGVLGVVKGDIES